MVENLTANKQMSMSGNADSVFFDYPRVQEELQQARLDQEQVKTDLKIAIERSNAMALKAEITNAELSQIINASIDGMFLIYEDSTVNRIKAALLSFLDMNEGKVKGKKCQDLMAWSWCANPEYPLTKILRQKSHMELDIELTRKDGRQVPFMFAATPFRGIDDKVIGMVARFKDITDRKYAENTLRGAIERLERLSAIDDLTQLANRRCFDQTLEREWNRLRRTKEPLSLIMSDVDFFKLFNDTYGHQGGDDCLKSIAKALSETVRRGGDCVARYGGEEFAIILPATDEKGAFHIAEEIRQIIKGLAIEHKKSSVVPCVTISLGVATIVPSDAGTPEVLINCADKALYAAKSSGRNLVIAWEWRGDAPVQD